MAIFLRILLLGGLICCIDSTFSLFQINAFSVDVDFKLPAIVYVYRSSRCPLLIGHFRQLQSDNLIGNCQLIVLDAVRFERIFGVACVRFPSVFFIKNGQVCDKVEGATSVEELQARAQKIITEA